MLPYVMSPYAMSCYLAHILVYIIINDDNCRMAPPSLIAITFFNVKYLYCSNKVRYVSIV